MSDTEDNAFPDHAHIEYVTRIWNGEKYIVRYRNVIYFNKEYLEDKRYDCIERSIDILNDEVKKTVMTDLFPESEQE